MLGMAVPAFNPSSMEVETEGAGFTIIFGYIQNSRQPGMYMIPCLKQQQEKSTVLNIHTQFLCGHTFPIHWVNVKDHDRLVL